MSEPLLSVRDLRVHYRGSGARRGRPVRAVDGVSFDLERGAALGLVGESGCGKSSTARALVGLVEPVSGSMRLDGEELCGLSRSAWMPHRRRVQMIFQDPYGSLDPRQTVGSIVAEPMRIHRTAGRRERGRRVLALLEAVGLSARHLGRYPHEFSGGQRQRIGIARALALEPELLICDEPVSALDVSIQAQILNLLGGLRERFGLALLLISHDLGVVRHLCERVAVLYLGRVVELAGRDELYAEPRHPYTRALLSAIPTPVASAVSEAPPLRERIVLTGEVPSPASPPAGCAFHPRCPERPRVPGDRCAKERPELFDAGGRSSACFLELL